MKHLSILLLLALPFASNANTENTIPYQHIVSIPDVSDVNLSPNGRYVAYQVKVEQKEKKGVVITLFDTETNQTTPLVFSNNEKYVVNHIFWGNNDNILINAKFPASRYGTPTTETRIIRLNIDSKKIYPVIPKATFKKMEYVPNIMSSIVDMLPEDDDYMLMQLAGFSQGTGVTVIKVPISDDARKRATIVQRTKSNVVSWLTDAKHEIRIGIRRKDTDYEILEKRVNGSLRVLWAFEAFSPDTVWPRGFGSDNNLLFVEALHNGKDAIFKVDLTDEKLTKELVFHHENYDVDGGMRRSKKTNDFVGIGYYYWDESYNKFINAIDKALPDTDNLLLDFSEDGNKYVLLSSNDRDPGMYLIGDRKNKKMDVFAFKKESLHPDLLAQKEYISYSARDGLTISGYLTVPVGAEKKNLPTIIFPHGGPISYDGKGFDYWTQFFANKGYAVLQMNFRGSSGYGYDFMQQGLANWGQAMQDDVEDGARWLIGEGIADKDKICIAGASYGGYAALMGTIKAPELYQCAISFAGVMDVEALVKSHRNYTGYEVVKKQIGDDFDKLWEVSPLKHAAKVNVPVLLIHGTKDRVVRVDHSEDMFDELEDEDKNVKYLEIEMADHYLSNNEHRLEAFKAMDDFLDTYLPNE